MCVLMCREHAFLCLISAYMSPSGTFQTSWTRLLFFPKCALNTLIVICLQILCPSLRTALSTQTSCSSLLCLCSYFRSFTLVICSRAHARVCLCPFSCRAHTSARPDDRSRVSANSFVPVFVIAIGYVFIVMIAVVRARVGVLCVYVYSCV